MISPAYTLKFRRMTENRHKKHLSSALFSDCVVMSDLACRIELWALIKEVSWMSDQKRNLICKKTMIAST